MGIPGPDKQKECSGWGGPAVAAWPPRCSPLLRPGAPNAPVLFLTLCSVLSPTIPAPPQPGLQASQGTLLSLLSFSGPAPRLPLCGSQGGLSRGTRSVPPGAWQTAGLDPSASPSWAGYHLQSPRRRRRGHSADLSWHPGGGGSVTSRPVSHPARGSAVPTRRPGEW